MATLRIYPGAYADGDVAVVAAPDLSVISTAGWDRLVVSDASALSGKIIQIADTDLDSGDGYNAVLDEVLGSQSGAVEVMGLFSITDPTTVAPSAIVGPALIAADGRAYGLRVGTTTELRGCIFSTSGQASDFIGSSFAVSPIGTNLLWSLVGRTADVTPLVYFSFWADGEGVPEAPLGSGTNSALTGLKAGFAARDSSGGPYKLHYLGIGTGGDAAPFPEILTPGFNPMAVRRRRSTIFRR